MTGAQTCICSYCKGKTLVGGLKLKFDKFFRCGHCGKKNHRDGQFKFPILRSGGDPNKPTQGGMPVMTARDMRFRRLIG